MKDFAFGQREAKKPFLTKRLAMALCLVGGLGFLGRHITQLAKSREIETRIVARSLYGAAEIGSDKARIFHKDDDTFWDIAKEIKLLIYLASSSIPATDWHAPARTIESEVVQASTFFKKLIVAAPDCKVIFCSSGGQIYGSGHNRPIVEEMPAAPRTAYALAKKLIEEVVEYHARVDGMKVTTLRLANPIGRWQLGRSHGFVASAILASLENRTIRVFGDGENIRDYFDANDFARLVCDLIDVEWEHGTYNIGSGIGRSENAIITIVASIVGKMPSIEFLPGRPFDLRYSVLDSKKAARLGWLSEQDLVASIAEIVTARKNEIRIP